MLSLPLSLYYWLVLCLAFAYVTTLTPIGRHIVLVGANRKAARLSGIQVNRVRAGSYIAAGTIAGLAGVLLVARVGSSDLTGSSTYLLPALAAVFLGTAIVTPAVQPNREVPWNLFPGDAHRQVAAARRQRVRAGLLPRTRIVIGVTVATLVRRRISHA